MAKFEAELPTDILKDVDFVANNSIKIFGGMTKAGAKVAKRNLENGTKRAFDGKLASQMTSKLKMTRTYETPSDKGINTKVAFYGYIPRKNGTKVKIKGKYTYNGVPAPLLAALREYGASSKGAMPAPFKKYWTKRSFVRPAFQDKAIEQAMLAEQKKLSGGILDD